MNPSLSRFRQFLVVLAEPPAPAEPGQRAFYHPPAGQHLELVAVRASAHHLQQPAPGGPSPRYQPSGVGCVSPDYSETGEASQQFGQHQPGPVTVLNVGCVNHHGQEEPGGIHYDVALASRHPLARVIAPGPPFSVVLTDWLSMMAPLGVASRPSLSRTVGRSASSTRPQVPSVRHFRKYHQAVPQGGRSWGIIRQGMPPRNIYRMLFTTSRRFTVRGCPLDESGGSRGSSKPHWASVKSVGYVLRSITQSYRLRANHSNLFQCRFRQSPHTLLDCSEHFGRRDRKTLATAPRGPDTGLHCQAFSSVSRPRNLEGAVPGPGTGRIGSSPALRTARPSRIDSEDRALLVIRRDHWTSDRQGH